MPEANVPVIELQHAIVAEVEHEIASFESGDPEVDNYFRSLKWARDKVPTYRVCDDQTSEMIGFVAAKIGKQGHPYETSPKAKYFVIYAAGLRRACQGKKVRAGDGETLAYATFRQLEEQGRKVQGCVGLYLWVRSTNERAIGFYRKFGFVDDPGGPVQRVPEGPPHLPMRKPFTQ